MTKQAETIEEICYNELANMISKENKTTEVKLLDVKDLPEEFQKPLMPPQ